MTSVVPVFNPRAEPRRAVKRGYPHDAGTVRLCRTLAAVERLLYHRLVDAVVLDVKTTPAAALALPARFPRIPMFVLSALRPDGAGGAAGSAGRCAQVAPPHRSTAARRVGGGASARRLPDTDGPRGGGAACYTGASVARVRRRRRPQPEAGHRSRAYRVCRRSAG